MKKALALLLAVLMLLSSVAIVASAEGDAQPAEINLEELYGATYVGAALGADDAKPVQDGVINENEYQIEYVVTADGVGDATRFGAAPTLLLGDYKQYVAHDAEWLYVGFDYLCGESENDGTQRGRFYWNLSFIDSFDVQYIGGTSINEAFKQNGYGFAEGWYFGAEVKDAITTDEEAGTSYWEYSARNGDNGTVTRGTAPVLGTDFFVKAWKENVATPADAEGNTKTHQVYEIKVSKAWYATQVGLDSAADVREIAWVTQGEKINLFASSYTQIGHYISDDDLAALAETGYTYTRSTTNSQPYDNAALPLLFVLDEAPIYPKDVLGTSYTNEVIIGEAATSPVVDGTIGESEYTSSRVTAPLDTILTNEYPEVYEEEYANFVTEYFAQDADYIYYAYSMVRDDTAPGAVFFIPLENNYTLKSIGMPGNRQLNATNALTFTGGAGDAMSCSDESAVAGEDFAYYNAGGEGEASFVEFKISKQYLADARGVDKSEITSFEYSVYENWNYYAVPAGSSWGYITLDHKVTADEAALLTAAGAAEVPTRLYNTVNLVPPTEVEINLQDWYGATYVGAALGTDDAKPVQDGVVSVGEYQAEYIVRRGSMDDPAVDTSRFGNPQNLQGDFNQYISHDADYFYVAIAFSTADEELRGRLYWNLLFVDSFNVTYYGGSTVDAAFKQGEYALNDGWYFGGEVKKDITTDEETGASHWDYSDRGSAIVGSRGTTAPALGTDVTVAVGKIAPPLSAGTNRQVYEFKVSKAWYAAQVGLESAADVRELAWVALGEEINIGGSSYTQIGHYIDDEDRAMLAATGLTYTPDGSGHPYDDASLPLLFILDADPNAEGEQPRVPAVQEPVGVPPTPDDGGDQPGDDPAGDQPAGDTPAATTTEATTTAKATTKAATTAAATTAAETEAKKGCKGSISISALVLLPTLAGGALLLKRRKED